MTESKRRDEWERTAVLCAAFVNSNPFRGKKKLAEPADFMPSSLRERPKRQRLMVGIDVFTAIFVPEAMANL